MSHPAWRVYFHDWPDTARAGRARLSVTPCVEGLFPRLVDRCPTVRSRLQCHTLRGGFISTTSADNANGCLKLPVSHPAWRVYFHDGQPTDWTVFYDRCHTLRGGFISATPGVCCAADRPDLCHTLRGGFISTTLRLLPHVSSPAWRVHFHDWD